MLKLKTLKFSNIGRFTEEQTIDFEKISGLVQIDGVRSDTGGSSGSGKSTIFNAIDYLLGLNDLPNTVLQSRLTKDGISVYGEFDLDGKTLIILRSKNKFVVEFEGEAYTGSKLGEEKLDQLVGMPRSLFRKILHKRQKEGGFFLDFTPSKTFEFLTDVLGHSNISKKADKVDVKIKALTAQQTQNDNKIENLNAQIATVQASKNALVLPETPDVNPNVISQLEEDIRNKSEELDILKRKHFLELETLRVSKPSTPEPVLWDKTKRAALQVQLKELKLELSLAQSEFQKRQNQVKEALIALNDEKNSINNEIYASNRARVEAESLAEEVKKIRLSFCPTCEQHWETDKSKAREQELIKKILSLKDVISKGESAQSRLPEITASIETLSASSRLTSPPEMQPLKDAIDRVESQISQDIGEESKYVSAQNLDNFAKLNDFSEKEKALIFNQSQTQSAHMSEISKLKEMLAYAKNQLMMFEDQKFRYTQTFNMLDQTHKKYTSELVEATATSKHILRQLEIAEEVKKAIKSFLSTSFDDALDYVGETATNTIRNIPNMANATIQLVGTRETKDGKVKEEVNALIHMDGEEAVPIKSLSGGERSAVDLAVDLAVMDLMETKTNVGVDVLLLDEPFNGLSALEIEMILEILKNSNSSKTILVIDHNPVVKAAIEDRIMVKREGTTSYLLK